MWCRSLVRTQAVPSKLGLTPIASCSLFLSHCLNSYGNNEADGEGGGYDADIGAGDDQQSSPPTSPAGALTPGETSTPKNSIADLTAGGDDV